MKTRTGFCTAPLRSIEQNLFLSSPGVQLGFFKGMGQISITRHTHHVELVECYFFPLTSW